MNYFDVVVVVVCVYVFGCLLSLAIAFVAVSESDYIVSINEVEKYPFVGPPPRREFVPPAPPSIDCPKCGALAGQWCSTFAPFAQLAQCTERAGSADVSPASPSVGGNPTVREGAKA